MLKSLRGIAGAYIAYPLAESFEKRNISSKVKELEKYYQTSFKSRKIHAHHQLVEILNFSNRNVPYYKDLFSSLNFDPESVRRDLKYLEDIPYLTKDIIREQGDRLLSTPLKDIRHHHRKTGGSTGVSMDVYYDQVGLDYSAAVTKYARQRVGHSAHKSELHFAASFAEPAKTTLPSKDDIKNFALNRSNAFFDRLDSVGLEKIWQTLQTRRVNLVHGHPSTLYALACYVESKHQSKKVFDIFESSGELLQPYMREKIEKVFSCKVIDRYGSAEFGVIAYELDGHENGLQILESEGWPESRKTEDGDELVFTGFHNRLMPLIRYATGDMAKVEERENAFVLTNVVGRIHDMVPINGIKYPTHNIMDILDHLVGGIQEFQIDLREEKPVLRIALEASTNAEETTAKIKAQWQDAFDVEYVGHEDFIRVGSRAKFRHVVK